MKAYILPDGKLQKEKHEDRRLTLKNAVRVRVQRKDPEYRRKEYELQ